VCANAKSAGTTRPPTNPGERGQNRGMKFIAMIRPTEVTEIEAEGETLAIAAKLPAGYQILAIRQASE
jgi:hypothetical protein